MGEEAKGLGVFRTKQKKLDELIKANWIEVQTTPVQQQVVAKQPPQPSKGSIEDNIKKMEQKREEIRKNMQELKREKAERGIKSNSWQNVDVEFEIMIDKSRLNARLIQEHQTTQNNKLSMCVRKTTIEKRGKLIDILMQQQKFMNQH